MKFSVVNQFSFAICGCHCTYASFEAMAWFLFRLVWYGPSSAIWNIIISLRMYLILTDIIQSFALTGHLWTTLINLIRLCGHVTRLIPESYHLSNIQSQPINSGFLSYAYLTTTLLDHTPLYTKSYTGCYVFKFFILFSLPFSTLSFKHTHIHSLWNWLT